MRKMLVALPMTLVAGAVLLTIPIPLLSTASQAKEITITQKEGCATNYRVCAVGGCQGGNADTGQPGTTGGFKGSLLEQCMKDCANKHTACLKTGSWKNKVIGGAGGTDVKTKPGGVATVPQTRAH